MNAEKQYSTLLAWHMEHSAEVTTDGAGRSWVVVSRGSTLGGHADTVMRAATVSDWQPRQTVNGLLLPTYAYDRVVVAGLRCEGAPHEHQAEV